MADYWGLEAISARMGCHTVTLYRLYHQQRFLMFQRHRASRKRGKPGKPRRTWYTNDELITRWEVAQCNTQHRERMAKRQASQAGRGVDERPNQGARVGA